MIDETKARINADKAVKAQRLLDDPLLTEAFTTLEREYTDALFSTNLDDANGREKLFLAVNIIRKIKDHLNIIMMDGKLANRQLKELADTAERQKQWPDIRP